MASIDTLFSAATGDPGKNVDKNATYLGAALTSDGTSISLDENVFSANDYLIIDAEVVKLGTYPTIIRGQKSSTPAAHSAEAMVRLWGGTALLSNTFDATEGLSVIRARGDIEAWYGIGIGTTVQYVCQADPERLEIFFPLTQITPADADIVFIVVWHWGSNLADKSANFHACMYK